MIRRGVRRAFRLALRRGARVADDVDEELALHLELRARQLEARGWPPALARAEAERRFGAIDDVRRALRRTARRTERTMHLRDLIDAFVQDLRHAARGLRREPRLTAMVTLILALGIGANAAMFGIVDRLLLRGPAHVREPGRVVRLYATTQVPGRGTFTSGTFGWVTYGLMREARSFTHVAAYAGAETTTGSGSDAQLVRGAQATWDFFPLLGVQPALGRFFGASEDDPAGAARVVVLDHGFWQRRYGGDSAVLGRTIELGGEPYTIIGVTPRGFTGAELDARDLWIPMSVRGPRVTENWTQSWNAQWLRVIGRLRPGATLSGAGAEATTLFRRGYTGDEPPMAAAVLAGAPLWFDEAGRETRETTVARWLVGVSAIVLLIACANVANLLLARAMRRRREVAVRLALGVSRARLVRLLLSDGIVLALLGGAASLAVAWWGGALVREVLLPDVAWDGAPVDGRVLAFTALAAIMTAILVGLVPAIQGSRADLGAALKAGAREGGGQRGRTRSALAVAQTALSVLLLVGAGLFVRSLTSARSLPLGIEPDRVLTAAVRWPSLRGLPDSLRAAERARRTAFDVEALQAARRMPGVEHAALVVGTPFQSIFTVRLRIPGRDSLPQIGTGGPYIAAVTDDYFATAGTRLLRGRAFTSADRAGSERVAIVNLTMANALWPAGDAIGQCLLIGADPAVPCARVVGVVEEARRMELRERPAMQYYVPFGQEQGIGGTKLFVRPRGDALAFIEPLRRELQRLRPSLGYVDIATLQESVDPQLRSWRLGATMFGMFGALALLVAAVGLYSVLAYLVLQRTHEIGVRIALGARPKDVVRLVARHGATAAVLGASIGLALALIGGRFIEPLLFETSPRDPVVLATVIAVLLVAAALASLVPARRATAVEPARALAAE